MSKGWEGWSHFLGFIFETMTHLQTTNLLKKYPLQTMDFFVENSKVFIKLGTAVLKTRTRFDAN